MANESEKADDFTWGVAEWPPSQCGNFGSCQSDERVVVDINHHPNLDILDILIFRILISSILRSYSLEYLQ